jgi:hypothetical protein
MIKKYVPVYVGDKVGVIYCPIDLRNVGRTGVVMELTKTKLAKIKFTNGEIDYAMIEHIRPL